MLFSYEILVMFPFLEFKKYEYVFNKHYELRFSALLTNCRPF
jgi:hypothetical protein